MPPVGNYGESDTFQFCFQSPVWEKVFPLDNCILLKKIFRQNDKIYAKILQNIRQGILKKQDYQILKQRLEIEFNSSSHFGCVPTKLFPLRAKADQVNNIMYNKLEGNNFMFEIVKKTDNINLENGKPIPRELYEKMHASIAKRY